MKRIFALLPGLLALVTAAEAEPIVLKRGLPTDIWLTWPDGERLGEPGLVEVFPEYRQTYRGHEFKLAKDAGFDFIRLTIDPAIFLWNPSAEKTSRLLDGLDVAVGEIRSAGLKVLVDMHSIPRTGGGPGTEQLFTTDAAFSSYLEVVRNIGQRLSNQPADEVGFELLNEPTLDCPEDMNGTAPRWPTLLQRLHRTARASAPDLTFVLSGACWGGADGLVKLQPETFNDENVIWSFHNYEPFHFTHQSAVWTDWYVKFVEDLQFPPDPGQSTSILQTVLKSIEAADIDAAKKAAWIDSATSDLNAYFDPGWAEERARAPFAKVAAWAKAHDIAPSRILLGEFGATRDEARPKSRAKSRYAFYQLMRTEAETRGYGWSTWSWSGGMGVSERVDGRDFDPAMLKALGLKP